MAPSQVTTADGRKGPHPSFIEVAKPFIFESKVHECLVRAKVSESEDAKVRLQGIAWIDSVRKAMHLPVRTYNTAAVYYHKFRLMHPDTSGYIGQDAAAAALFAACKIEDTLKKSKEILCAAHNLKAPPSERQTPDDPVLTSPATYQHPSLSDQAQGFEQHSKAIIGLERLMLEASGFDFRNRYPQRLVLKIVKHYYAGHKSVGKTAYNMCSDLYRTFVPLKQTTPAMAMACVELAGRLCEQRHPDLEAGKGYEELKLTRAEVMETLLDLLDLYTHFKAQTTVGQDHSLEKFLAIRIVLNKEAEAHNYPRYAITKAGTSPLNYGTGEPKDTKGSELKKTRSPTSPVDVDTPDVTSPTANGRSAVKPGLKEGTVRFMLSAERARDEKEWVGEYFRMEEEEYVVEVPLEKEKGWDKYRLRDRDRDRGRYRDRDWDWERDRYKERERPRYRERERDWERERDREWRR
ncbi:MAG: hypothetical protein Q9163_001215 [Psora crenata]